MRREHGLDESGIVLIIAVVLLLAALIPMLRPTEGRDVEHPFSSVDAGDLEPTFGLGKGLFGQEPEIRLNQLPQL
ncbi:MAG: hypothetical protein AAF689_17025 [Pseudomonadota bacterium]